MITPTSDRESSELICRLRPCLYYRSRAGAPKHLLATPCRMFCSHPREDPGATLAHSMFWEVIDVCDLWPVFDRLNDSLRVLQIFLMPLRYMTLQLSSLVTCLHDVATKTYWAVHVSIVRTNFADHWHGLIRFR